MSKEAYQTPLGGAILTALFCGIVATLVCFGFEIFYRLYTGYDTTQYVNVSSLIFGVNSIAVLAGFTYFYMHKWMKKSGLLFSILFAFLTAYFIFKVMNIQLLDDKVLNTQFHQLVSGTLLIIGIFTIIIPLLINNKKFNEMIL